MESWTLRKGAEQGTEQGAEQGAKQGTGLGIELVLENFGSLTITQSCVNVS